MKTTEEEIIEYFKTQVANLLSDAIPLLGSVASRRLLLKLRTMIDEKLRENETQESDIM
jgi:hypothetical protein